MLLCSKEKMELYTEYMNNLKKLNSDWLSLRNSKEYKFGMVINKTCNTIKHLNFKALFINYGNWLKGYKSKKINDELNLYEKNDLSSNYFSNDRIAIYTVVFGNYDSVPEPLVFPNNCDYFIFTDQDIKSNSKWIKKEIPKELQKLNNIEKNRFLKINPDMLFPDYKYSIYIDGNIQVITDLTEYVNKLNNYGLATFMHNTRNCVYSEIKAVMIWKKEKRKNLMQHKKHLEESKMPHNYGLLQCSVLVREHNNPICKKIMREWWDEFMKYSKRDQISLPYVLFSNNILVKDIGILGINLYHSPSFRVLTHNK